MKKFLNFVLALVCLGGLISITACNTTPNNDNTNEKPNENENNNNDSENNGDDEKTTFVVSYYVDGTVSSTENVIENQTIQDAPNPTKTGYTFKGWYTDANYTNEFVITTPITESISLYAKFEANKYTVTYKDSDNSVISTDTVEYNTTPDKPTDPTKTNYKFVGWYTDLEYTDEFDFTSDKIIENTTLYAKWIEDIGDVNSITVTDYKGYNEGLYVEFSKINALSLDNYTVSYKNSTSSTYTTVDSQLIRSNDTTIRVDIVGLIKGNYDVKIDIKDQNITKTISNITVYEADRSGYAHFVSADNAIGAYNDDGSLKDNADIIYVTNETKNTVTYNGKTGLVAILQSLDSYKKPVVIRIIGKITTNQYKEKSNEPRLTDNSNLSSDFFNNELETTYGENLVGLKNQYMDKKEGVSYTYLTTETGLKLEKTGSTSVKTTTYKGSEYPKLQGKKVYDDDSYFNMLDVEGISKGLTIEGIGTDAEIFQWGFTFKNCKNVEIKNITFTSNPEDACSFEGTKDKHNTYTGYWIHNCTFNRGDNNWDISGERDKYAGDGAMDFKYCRGVTASYNKYNNCKKTGLVGGDDSNIQLDFTFHHNYYNNVESRLPLGRQANMHIYNNYYYAENGKSSATLDLRANAFALSEANYFDGYSAKPRATVVAEDDYYPAIKSYNDYYASTTKNPSSSYEGATIVTNRTATVSNGCNIDGVDYSSFDTNSSLFYYDSTNKKSNVSYLTDAQTAKTDCINNSGVLSGSFVGNEGNNDSTEDNPTPTWQTVLTDNFEANKTITEITSNPTGKGLYYSYTSGGDNTNNQMNISNGTLNIIDESAATTYGYYIFDSYSTGKVQISLDFIPQTSNGKWTPIHLVDSNMNTVLGIRTDDSKCLGYTLDNGTTVNQIDSNAMVANTTYTITLTIDFDNNSLTIDINGNTVNTTINCEEITGIKFQTAGSASRSFGIDNLVIKTA